MKKIYPVIHYRDLSTTERNLKLIIESGCDGVFLINMDGTSEVLNSGLSLARELGGEDFFVGVNRLNETNLAMGSLMVTDRSVNGIWVDNPGLYSDVFEWSVDYLSESLRTRKKEDPDFNFFGSVAFKTQRKDPNPGIAANLGKIQVMKEAIEEWPLAIASGITPENVDSFLPYVDYFLVATGISKDFFNFDEEKVKMLVEKVKKF